MAIETITILDADGVRRDVYADQLGAAFAQLLKVAWGSDGVVTLVEAANPLPVTDAGGITALSQVVAALTAINANVDSLESFTDGLEALLGRLPSGGAASETTLASALTALNAINASTDGLEGFTDGIEALLGRLPAGGAATEASLASAVTALAAINANTDGLEGFVDGLETLNTAIRDRLPAATASGAQALTTTGLITSPNSAGDVVSTLTNGRKTITTAGTAEAIRATLACKWVIVTALKLNTSDVYVGGSGVVADAGSQTGTPLSAGEGMTFPVDDAAKLYIDVLVNGEGVSFTVGS